MEKISVIIVNWNVTSTLQRCVKSVLATKYPNLELIIVDNNSVIKPLVVSIQNKVNLGFPKAVNQGLKKSTGDYLLLLNPDTRLPKDFFVKMVDFCKSHFDVGVVGPKFTDPDGTPQGSVFPELSIFGSSQKYTPMSSGPITVNAISGACMFLPRGTIEKIGLLTEEVFMYYEDLDYCRRVRKAGLRIYFHPGITIIHEHGQSAQKNPQAGDWRGYLWKSSLWYNGPIKHYLMWFISWTRQKLNLLK